MNRIKSKIVAKINREIDSASRFISMYPDRIDYFSQKIEALYRVRETLKDIESENVVKDLQIILTINLAKMKFDKIKEGEVQALEDLKQWLENNKEV